MAPEPEELSRAAELSREIEHLAAKRELWPNFDPLSVPVAYYDGRNTYLFRYPGEPDGFAEVDACGYPALVFNGRHPAVVANSTIDLDGTPAASLLTDAAFPRQTPVDFASMAIHEAFHVFQSRHHPTWAPDIGTLFLYPAAERALLLLRRIETESFRRALTTDDGQEKTSWTWRALEARKDRFSMMDARFSSYERQEELLEGLAAYVESRAVGRTKVDLPEKGFPADDVRGRAYKIGHTLAVLLDTFAPDWKINLEKDDSQSLDLYLARALDDAAGSKATVEFTQSEIDDFEAGAEYDTTTLRERRVRQREAFEYGAANSLTVIAPVKQPLRVTGMDPSNVTIVDGGVLHTRYIALAGSSGRFEMMSSPGDGGEALTESAGSHPISSGIRRLQVVGCDKLDTRTDKSTVEVSGNGLSARFDNVTLEEHGARITVRLK